MTRRLGVLVALLALAATASADKAKPKAPPAKASAKDKDKAPAAADTAPAPDATADGSAADGSDAPPALPDLPHISGPKLVDLGNNTEIDLPAGLALYEHDAAKKLVEAGGGNGATTSAVIFPEDLTQTWFVTIDFADAGYVTDTDANDLDAGQLLESYRQATNEDNLNRKKLGVPELFVDSWSEPPRYDKSRHVLLWGLNAHDSTGPVINYFTRVLGREGFMSVNLVDSPDKLAAAKQASAAAIANTRFKTGHKYEDHKDGDKSSGMGLKALVVGGAGVAVFGAAKSGGFIAILLALKKGVILIVAGIAAFFKKIFGGKKKDVQLPPDGPPPVG